MDDFDSFSTVVSDAPKKDDFDSFSSVVSEEKPKAKAAPAKVAVAPKLSLLDRAKAAISEGADNLAKEVKSGHALDNAVAGGIHGVMSLAGGASQIVAHGLKAGADKFAPGTGFQQWANKTQALTDADVQRLEDNYQRSTKGSVLAGAARAGVSIAPVGAAEQGASLMVKAGVGARNGAAVAALQPVDHAGDMTNAQFAKEKGIQTAVGAGLGAAAPVAARGVLEAASKLGSKKAEQALTNTRKAQLFNNSPNAKADAEVITELGGINDRIGDRKVLTHDISARQTKIAADTLDAMKAAGATPEQITTFKTWQGMTKAEKDGFRNTEMGQPVAAIMDKLDRIRALTPGELANNALAPVRGTLDLAPIPAPVRFGLKNLLGGRTTRNADAAKVLDPRSQRAAQQYLADNGVSDATKGMQTLKDMATAASNKTDAESITAQRLAAQNKAMQENPSLLVPSIADPAQREAELANLKNSIMGRDKEQTALTELKAKQNGENPSFVVPSIADPVERDFTNQSLKDAITKRAKAQDQISKLIGKQNGPYPSLVVPSVTDPGAVGEGSKAIRDAMIARARDQASSDKASQAAKAATDASALQIKARKISGTPGGGAYQALLQHTGLNSDDLNQALRIAQNIPEAAPHVRAIRVDGGNTTDGAIYPITDIVNSIADKMGMPRGALTQAQPTGALTDAAEQVTARYQMGTKVRQGLYKEAQAKAAGISSVEARKAAVDLAGKLKSTPKRTERISLIDSLEAKYPETQGIFDEVRNFK